MTDSNEVNQNMEVGFAPEVETSGGRHVEIENEEASKKSSVLSPDLNYSTSMKPGGEFNEDCVNEKNDSSSAFIRTILTSQDCPKNSVEVFKKLSGENYSGGSNENVMEEIIEKKVKEEEKMVFKESGVEENAVEGDAGVVKSEQIHVESFFTKETKITSNPVTKENTHLAEGCADSSHSSSSEVQLLAIPLESSSSCQENKFNSNRINFENAIPAQSVWRESNTFITPEVPVPSKQETEDLASEPKLPSPPNIPVITIDENTEPAIEDMPPNNLSLSHNEADSSTSKDPVFPPLQMQGEEKSNALSIQPETKLEESNTLELPAPQPVPVLPPVPRKRGRPRKQVLPNPSPLVESWGPGSQEFVALNVPSYPKRSTRSERKVKKKKFDEEENETQNGCDGNLKRHYSGKTPVKKKKRSTYIPKKRGPQPKKKQAEMEDIQNFEEETRMSASEGHVGLSSSRSGAMGDESQGSFLAAEGQTKSNINKKGRMEVMTDGCKPITVQQIVEYHWPPPSSLPPGEKPEGLMIQEQITEYLGVKSFKRKYPSIKRRPVDMEERNYLQENGFVSENMCDLGLTAVFSSDIIEIMYNDFPQKFEEYRKYTREKKAKEQRALREKQAAERADLDPLKEAVESAQSWNAEFNKTRREKRSSCFDLQTFTVHFPANRYKRISLGKPGNYPIALIPGQNTDYYKKYTSNELKYFPLNTVLYGPVRPNERHFALQGGSDGSQSEIDDSSSSDESSSSSSEETQDTEETSSTIEEEGTGNAEVKSEKETEEKETPKLQKTSQKTPKGRGRGKVVATNLPAEPKKRLGRPPKLKLAAIKLKRLDGEEISELIKEEKLDATTRVIIHTCKMCHEEESKNKNGEFESFIECTQCKGKIHPSCIDLTAEMIPKISSYGWQCTDCKSCIKCGQSSNEDKMIFCDHCDRGYHIFCVGLNEVPSGNYICLVCKPPIPSGNPIQVSPDEEKGRENGEIKEESSQVKIEIKTEDEKSEKNDNS